MKTLNNLKHLFNALTAAGVLRILTDFTLSNARRFYSSVGNPLAVKGLRHNLLYILTTCEDLKGMREDVSGILFGSAKVLRTSKAYCQRFGWMIF